jgi:hypothetical protein
MNAWRMPNCIGAYQSASARMESDQRRAGSAAELDFLTGNKMARKLRGAVQHINLSLRFERSTWVLAPNAASAAHVGAPSLHQPLHLVPERLT